MGLPQIISLSTSFPGDIADTKAANTFTENQTFQKDIEVTDTTKGLILKAPNGSRWRLTIENDGSLTTTSL